MDWGHNHEIPKAFNSELQGNHRVVILNGSPWFAKKIDTLRRQYRSRSWKRLT
jgi:hypothetical protein